MSTSDTGEKINTLVTALAVFGVIDLKQAEGLKNLLSALASLGILRF